MGQYEALVNCLDGMSFTSGPRYSKINCHHVFWVETKPNNVNLLKDVRFFLLVYNETMITVTSIERDH